MLKDTKISSKVIVGFLIAIVVALAVGLIGRQALIKNTEITNDIANVKMPSVHALQEMFAGQLQAAAGQRGLVIHRMMDPQSRQANYEASDAGFRRLAEARRLYEPLPQVPEEARIWQRLVPALDEWRRLAQGIVDLQRQKDNALAQGMKMDDPQIARFDDLAYQAMLKTVASRAESAKLLEELVDINYELGQTAAKEAAATASSSMMLLTVLLLLGTVLVVATSIVVIRTTSAAIQALRLEAARLAEAAVNGQLQTRGNVMAVPVEFRPIVQGINDTLDAVIGPLNVAADYVDRISKGRLPEKITDRYNGDFNAIKNNLNQCIDAIGRLVADATLLSKAAVDGKLATRADASKHEGDYHKIVQGVNETLNAVIGPLNVAADYVDKISKGSTPNKITDNYNGDFNTIKNNLNTCIDAITQQAAAAQGIAEGNLSVTINVRSESDVVAKSMLQITKVLTSLQTELKRLTTASNDGLLSERGKPELFKGAYAEVVGGVNQMLDAILLPIGEGNRVLGLIRGGNLRERVEIPCKGDHDKMKQAVNGVHAWLTELTAYVTKLANGNMTATMAKASNEDQIHEYLVLLKQNIQNLVVDANMLSKAAVDGKLATRADASKHEGDFRKVVQGVNDTLDSVIGPLNVAADYVDKISKGQIPAKITDSYNGDFNALKNNLNQCIEAVNLLVVDAQSLAEAAIEGRLSTRADASKHAGDFRRVVEGVNKTLDAVINPVMEATTVLESLAQYDLRARMLGNYNGDHARIKTALNNTGKALHDALSQVADAVEQVSEASRQIASSSQSVAQGASEQASSLEETSSSLEEMSSMTKQNADNTVQAKTLAQSTKEAAEKGGHAMTRMIDAMEKIRAASEGTSQIIKDINEIAFQTNLLALNAAVEAARAGDAGRGFAVVAEEVRNLALRSKEAAKKTEDLIKMSVGHAENGRVISGEVAGNLTEIVSAAGKVNDIVSEIAVASQEQSRGIEQVNTAVSEMDKVVQVAAANAEESSSAAEELSSQSEELTSLVSRFQLESEGTKRVTKRDVVATEQRRRAVGPSIAPRRPAAPSPARPRPTSLGTTARKPTAEDAIPFNDPEFRDF